MPSYVSHIIHDNHFILSSERVVFWENENALVLADLHIGKSGHFRKAGIGIPQSVYKDDLHRLLSQLLFFKAEKLIIVGDLSHSRANKELDLFYKWRHDFPSLEIQLARGNHDILDDVWYKETNIMVHEEELQIGKFCFVHDPVEQPEPGKYYFSGHVHPAVSIRGKAKQSLKFPCFYLGKQQAILPAFSRFTGNYPVKPGPGEKAFAIVEKDIVCFDGR